MTNREIRALAKQKRNTGGLMLSVFVGTLFSGGMAALEYFIGPKDLTPDYVLIGLFYLIVSLVSTAGLARVSVSAWNGNAARLAELFSYVTNWRMFGRALAVSPINLAVVVGMQAPLILVQLAMGGRVPYPVCCWFTRSCRACFFCLS